MTELLRDYKPYSESALRVIRLEGRATNQRELELMNESVAKTLSNYTIDHYFTKTFFATTKWIDHIYKSSGVRLKGRILEFGAGICKTSAVLSQNPDITEIHCLDFSEPVLREMAPRVISRLKGDLSKFTFLVGDMNNISTVPGPYDAVICYGSVHHLTLPEHFFSELSRHLKPGAPIIAMAEHALPIVQVPLKALRDWKQKIWMARQKGDHEYVYTIQGYRRMFGDAYQFKLIKPKRQSWLRTIVVNDLAPWIWFRSLSISFTAHHNPDYRAPALSPSSLHD